MPDERDEPTPRVTIVTPSFNQARFLEETILSVLEQDYPNIEYAIVDGGSSDGSIEIIERYADRLAWWTAGPDGGQAAALNAAFARASGDYLGWLNSDDTLLPGSVSRAVAALRANPEALLVYGDAIYTDEHSRETGRFHSVDLDPVEMARTCTDKINPQGALFRRRALELAGPLEGFYTFDFEFVMRIGIAGPVVRLPEPLATFRLHADSKSMGVPVRRAADYLSMYDRFFSRELPPEVRAVEAEGRARTLVWAGELFYAGLEHASARECYFRAMRLHPPLSGRCLGLLARACLPAWGVRRLRAARSGQ